MFPQDLIDHIIDLVATADDIEDSLRNLIACSLVSKSFRYRCTKHRFSSVHLSYFRARQQDSPLQQYPTIVQQNPTIIAQYIKDLILLVSFRIEDLVQESSLPIVTETVSPLRSFTLIGVSPESPLRALLLDWEVVSIALDKRRQMSNPLLSSKLTTLCLEDVRNVPPTLFSVCINLTSITFKNVELQPSSSHTQGTLSDVETGKLSRPRLLAFKLGFFSRTNLLERLFPPRAPPLVDLNGLRSLEIRPRSDYGDEDMVAIRELMAISKDSLHKLSWYHWQFIHPARFGFQPPPPAVDLSLFPALRILEIPLIMRSDCSVLATIFNSPITLDMLTIPIFLHGEDDDLDDEETEDDDNSEEEAEDDTGYVPRHLLKYTGIWRRLVNVLLRTSRSRSESNPIARHILFNFYYPGPKDNSTQEYREKHRLDWEESISALVKKAFVKLNRGDGTFKFEYTSC